MFTPRTKPRYFFDSEKGLVESFHVGEANPALTIGGLLPKTVRRLLSLVVRSPSALRHHHSALRAYRLNAIRASPGAVAFHSSSVTDLDQLPIVAFKAVDLLVQAVWYCTQTLLHGLRR
jgi:hypothetical protein